MWRSPIENQPPPCEARWAFSHRRRSPINNTIDIIIGVVAAVASGVAMMWLKLLHNGNRARDYTIEQMRIKVERIEQHVPDTSTLIKQEARLGRIEAALERIDERLDEMMKRCPKCEER